MKKSKVCILTGITAGALLLTGCRETPDSVIVKQKGEKAIEKYEEEKQIHLPAKHPGISGKN